MDNAVFYPICDIIPDDEGHGMIIGNFYCRNLQSVNG